MGPPKQAENPMMGANTWEWLFSISNKEIFEKEKKDAQQHSYSQQGQQGSCQQQKW